MSKRNRIIALFTAAVMLLTSVSVSFAWFAKLNSADLDENGGSVVTRYFHKGDGTAENPYEITRPVHFYNLVMLYQANPAVKGSDFITASTHFRIGTKDLDHDGIDELDEFSVFEYDDSGVTNNNTSQTLNLASYTDGLFPIGSAEKPFQATLDGENITIKNLKIAGSTSLNGKTYTTPDIGLFGYVSNKGGDTEQTPTIKNLYIDSMTIDLTNVDISGKNLNTSTTVTHDPTKHTDHAAYVGYIAGHIITGAQVNDVYVNNCTVTGGNEAYSGFGFFGCVEDKDGNIVTTLGQEIITQRTKGDNAGFGGSVDMKQMQERLQKVFADTNATTPANYNSVETIVINENDGTRTVTESEPKARNNTYYNYKYYTTPYAGKYYFWQRDDMANYQFMCLYGDSSKNKKTVNKYTITAADMEAFYISNGSLYLSAAANGVTATDKSGALKWSFDESGHLFAYINNDVYYLNRNGLSGVAVSQSASTVWIRNEQDALYTTVNGIDYYLNCSAEWGISSFTQYCYISDSNGNFLSATNGTGGAEIANARSESSSVKWQVTVSGDKYKFRTEIGDKSCYLTVNGSLALTESAEDEDILWTLESDGYFTRTLTFGNVSVKYRLVYDNGWKAACIGKLITDGNNNYLSADTKSIKNAAENTALVWQTEEDTNGIRFYTFINSVPYYISFSSGLTVSETPFNWKKDGNSYYYTNNGRDYYIRYNNGWEAVTLEYKLITDGNGNYLKADGNNSFSNAAADNATRFYFLKSDSGNITYNFNNSQYYLGVSNGSFADTATNWSFTANGCLKADNTDYYLVYDGGWKISLPKYTISSGNNYLSINSSGNIISEKNQANAAKWTFSNPSAYSGTVSTVINGTTKYLSVSRSGNWFQYSYTLNTSNNSGENWSNNGKNMLYVNKNSGWGQNDNFYITTNNSWKDLNKTGTALTFTPIFEHVAAEARSDNLPEIAVQEKVVPSTNVNISNPITVDYSLGFEKTTQKRINKETKTNVSGGYQTYFPLRIADENENGWYDAADPFKVSQKNTGYIISSARIEDTNAAANQKAAGDIRISYFPISSVSGSYDTATPKAFKTIYTVDGSGKHSYTANSSVYQTASEQLLDTLYGSPSVYGLHFMDAKISKDYLVTAEKAVVLGKEYDNYEMPMDSIDFNVIERGSINFFAGDYFTDNNSFFSLHQVFRDENNKITDIKEIAEIYEHKDYKALRPYIYKFSDGTYSNADGNYTGATSIDTSAYTSVFNTKWITEPGISQGNKIYYFEIPCNKGEYCLGSVSGKTGAYLIYLDIAANGGEAIKKVISSEGNAVTNAFKTEYRTAPARLGENNYSVLLFSTTAPQGTNQNNFSVNLSFKKMDSSDPDYSSDYANGVYIITVTNKSNSDIQLDVFLCDDDRDITNDFLYAYKVVYNNSDHTGTAVPTVLNSNYWQAMASFKIPPTGEAGEISYKS